MKEVDVRRKVMHAGQWLDYRPVHWQDYRVFWKDESVTCGECGHQGIKKVKFEWFPEITGRADLEFRHPRFPMAYVECKAVGPKDLAFAFSEIREKQRDNLNGWMNDGGQGFLAVGKIVSRGNKTSIYEIWVVTWSDYLLVEQICLEEGVNSLPFDLDLYKNLPKLLVSFSHAFEPRYKLLKDNNGDYHFHPDHPLFVQPEVEVPFFKLNKEER